MPPSAASRSKGISNLKDSESDRKLLVIYGLDECTEGTPRHVRISTDVDSVTKTIQSVCPDISCQSICGCTRLGWYSNDRHRPVLVKLTRSCDVSNILANRGKLSNLLGISIKPLMSHKERNTESILLRERYILINSGTSKSDIKIRRNALYINNTKYTTQPLIQYLPSVALHPTLLRLLLLHLVIQAQMLRAMKTSLKPILLYIHSIQNVPTSQQ